MKKRNLIMVLISAVLASTVNTVMPSFAAEDQSSGLTSSAITFDKYTFVPAPSWYQNNYDNSPYLGYMEDQSTYRCSLYSDFEITYKLSDDNQNILTDYLTEHGVLPDAIHNALDESGMTKCYFLSTMLNEDASILAKQIYGILSKHGTVQSLKYTPFVFDGYQILGSMSAPDGGAEYKLGVYSAMKLNQVSLSEWLTVNAPEWQEICFNEGKSIYICRADGSQNWDQGEYIELIEHIYNEFSVYPDLNCLDSGVSVRSNPVYYPGSGDAEILDLNAYIGTHFTSASGQPLHLIDAAGWFSSEITGKPNYAAFESYVCLYSDALAPDQLMGELYAGTFTSLIRIDFSATDSSVLSEADTLLGGLADSRETLEYGRVTEDFCMITDYALQSNLSDKVMALLTANPELLAGISQVTYEPVNFQQYLPDLDRGIHFMLTDAQRAELKTMIDEENLPWTLTESGALTGESQGVLLDILTKVPQKFGAVLKPSILDDPTPEILMTDTVQTLYKKGDGDSDGTITLQDASAVLKQYNLTDILGEDGFMTAEEIAAADVDGDGAVTPKDASLIQQYINFADILEEPKTWEELIKK